MTEQLSHELMTNAYELSDEATANDNKLLRIIAERLADVVDSTFKAMEGKEEFNTVEAQLKQYREDLLEVAKVEADFYDLSSKDKIRLTAAIMKWTGNGEA